MQYHEVLQFLVKCKNCLLECQCFHEHPRFVLNIKAMNCGMWHFLKQVTYKNTESNIAVPKLLVNIGNVFSILKLHCDALCK